MPLGRDAWLYHKQEANPPRANPKIFFYFFLFRGAGEGGGVRGGGRGAVLFIKVEGGGRGFRGGGAGGGRAPGECLWGGGG